jgi:holo-[acyl-carrier protein] synthase
MIRGVGIDVADVRRIRETPDLEGLLEQVLTPGEIARVAKNGTDPGAVAMLFSAKEALLKALGCGAADGWHWREIDISEDLRVVLSGHLRDLAENRSVSRIQLSISSFKDHALSLVLLDG